MKIALYNLYFQALGGGERRTAALAEYLSRDHQVVLFVTLADVVAQVRDSFGIDLSAVEIVVLSSGADHHAEIAAHAPDVFINNSHASELKNPGRFGIYMCMFPENERMDLSSYDVVTANSAYTAKWIERKWGYGAEVVYSACAPMGPPREKERVILAVGRFMSRTASNHHKRQDVLAQAFARLVDEGLAGWELHLVGHVADLPDDRAFADEVAAMSEGYPIRMSHALPLDDLRAEYRRAPIFWHAAGFGTDEEREPHRQEHFGMSVIEAMSAGAVPIAYDGGGPRETISHGRTGLLWTTIDDLVLLTRRAIEEPDFLQDASAAAVAQSRAFDGGSFLRKMAAIVDRATIPSDGLP